MSSTNQLNKGNKQNVPDEGTEALPKREALNIGKHITNFQTKFRNLVFDNFIVRKVQGMGNLAKGVVDKIRSFSPPKPTKPQVQPSQDSLTATVEEPERLDEPEEVRKADKVAAFELEKQRAEMQKSLLPEMNSYRQQSNVDNANTEGFQIMRKPNLSVDPDLQEAAEIIASELTKGGRPFEHLDDWNANWRDDARFAKIKDKLKGEMIQRGGRTGRHVVMKFRDSKQEKETNRHHEFLNGDFGTAGTAVASYTDPSTGETMFYSIVLLGADDQLSGLPQSIEPKKSEIYLDNPELVEVSENTTIDQIIGKRSALKAHFVALETRRRLMHRDTTVSFDLQSTKEMPLDERQMGSFYVQVAEVKYMVSDHPPVFNYWMADKKQFVSVPFREVFDHAQMVKTAVQQMKEAPADSQMTEQELADENVPTADELSQTPVKEPEGRVIDKNELEESVS